MRLDQNLFSNFVKQLFSDDTKVIFVADYFAEDLIGGAELTLQALIDTAPCKIEKIKCSEITIEHLKQGIGKYWVFGNYASINPQLIPTIASSLRYSVVECDYKFCKHRSLEKHLANEGKSCDCSQADIGKVVSSFLSAADHIWWMSEAQRDIHHKHFSFLADYQQTVLSSVFDDKFFTAVESLRAQFPNKNGKWLVLQHDSWIKGTDDAVELAKSKSLDYKLIGNVSYKTMLSELAQAEGLVFLPRGGDTCPRLVIEAKLLGCKLFLNDNVQHAKESWFDTDDIDMVESYIRAAPGVFWRGIAKHMEREYTLSGYVTTYNCLKQGYPVEECVESMLGFCDEVVVVDAGSEDGTLNALEQIQTKYVVENAPVDLGSSSRNSISRLKIHVVKRDWNDPRSALFDGMQKAEARARCSGDFVWQQDVDEVVCKNDFHKIKELVKQFPKSVPMLSLPVVEFWGGFDKVRIDVTPWKWRLSRNSPRITHGVPAHLRTTDSEGLMVAKPGTDGCDPIDVNTGEPIVFLGFLSNEMDQKRVKALHGDKDALMTYSRWFEQIVNNVPSVYHLSWIDIARKIRLYRDFWTRHWNVLEGKKYVDTAESNMFFDMPWSAVTEQDIQNRANELAEGTGGHVFHSKWSGHNTPHMSGFNVPADIKQIKM